MEDERKQGRHLPRNVGLRQGLFYRDLVDFPAQVERYYAAFGRDGVRVFLYDDLAADPASVYRDLCGFIGVDANFETTFEVVNANKRARLGWLRDQLWKPSPCLRQAARAMFPEARKRQMLGSWLRSWNTIREQRKPMERECRRRLLEEFTPSIERLGALIDRDLGGWLAG